MSFLIIIFASSANASFKISDLFTLNESEGDSNDYHRKKNIITAVQKAEDEIRHLRIKASKLGDDSKIIFEIEMDKKISECLKVVSRNVSNDHVLALILKEIDSGEKKEITEIKSLLFACLLFEKNGRLLSKVKTPESYSYAELKLATEQNVEQNEITENIYGYPHVIKVDGNAAVGNYGKIEVVDGRVVFYDANGNEVPPSILDV